MKNVIITGATGVIGMALIRKCIEEDVKVTILANPDSKRLDRIPNDSHVTIIPCGLSDYKDVDASSLIAQGARGGVFYHLSWGGTFGDARNDMALQNKNVEYTLDAVRLAHSLGCDTFVGVGSQAEYGRVEGLLCEDTPTNPENGYGCAKLEAMGRSKKLCQELGMKHIWTRVLSIYGPYDGKKTMVTSTVRTLLEGGRPPLTKGEQMWDYLYADDAAKALLMLGDNGVDGRIYPIGYGVARPLREYIEQIRDAIDPKLTLGFGEVPYSDKQVMYLCADISGLTEDTGFEAEIDFAEGIRRTIEWVREDMAADSQ